MFRRADRCKLLAVNGNAARLAAAAAAAVVLRRRRRSRPVGRKRYYGDQLRLDGRGAELVR